MSVSIVGTVEPLHNGLDPLGNAKKHFLNKNNKLGLRFDVLNEQIIK